MSFASMRDAAYTARPVTQPMWDFQRRPMRRTFAHPRPGSVTSWLIFLSVLVYVVDGMLLKWGQGYPRATPAGPVVFPPLYYWGHFSKMLAIDHFQIWRFITFQFLHGGFDH